MGLTRVNPIGPRNKFDGIEIAARLYPGIDLKPRLTATGAKPAVIEKQDSESPRLERLGIFVDRHRAGGAEPMRHDDGRSATSRGPKQPPPKGRSQRLKFDV